MNTLKTTSKSATKTRLVDIDGTICTDISNENSHLYPFAKKFDYSSERINKWYENGDFIVFFTAREEKDRQTTENWLKSNGFKYHYLLMGKPRNLKNGGYWWLDNAKGEYEQFTGSWENVEG